MGLEKLYFLYFCINKVNVVVVKINEIVRGYGVVIINVVILFVIIICLKKIFLII